MKVLYDSLRGFARDERGGECLEYALEAGMITVVALSAIAAVGNKVKGYWQALDQALGV
jgi:Flp pilus assembly pilin Flp